uniref:non-specific serine/threonine protein kinase n=1 Tax=Myripristis murdjan TaxID=586833 RepID=A0A667YCR6_9TELE
MSQPHKQPEFFFFFFFFTTCRQEDTDLGGRPTEFQAKYLQAQPLGKGGFGSVFAGFRIADYLPLVDGKLYQFPLEVELLLQVGAGAGPSGSSAAVTLLDWFYMEQQLILVMERPFPSVDLHHYLTWKGEGVCVCVCVQLVDAAIEIHTKGVFHRDLKPRNILMDIRSQLPCVRLIDFGCGATLHEGLYTEHRGTFYYTPPEWFRFRRCSAGPTTVWQVGVVLFEMLFSYRPFKTESQIIHSHLVFGDEVSQECQHFLSQCLAKSPESRPTLEQLRLHPWLKSQMSLGLLPTIWSPLLWQSACLCEGLFSSLHGQLGVTAL